MGEGGDLYQTFVSARKIDNVDKDVARVVIDYLRASDAPIAAPTMGRLVPHPN